MQIALVADWLVTRGGAEHVLQEFLTLFPKAPLFTSVALCNRDPLDHAVYLQEGNTSIAGTTVFTTPLQQWYRILRRHQILLPFMPRVMEGIDLKRYNVILSSSHAVGKGILPSPHALHVCYCHTPMRYAWEMEEEYLNDFCIPQLLKPLARKQLRAARRWDLSTAKRVDVFLANSTATQERIARIYERESAVLRPPVHDRFFQIPLQTTDAARLDADLSATSSRPSGCSTPRRAHGRVADDSLPRKAARGPPRGLYGQTRRYYLAVGRLVPYKRFDLLIEVANARKLPLKIAGTGMDERRLRSCAGPTVEFLGHVPDEDLPALYAGAAALLSPQWEDAGLVPLEALASGTPVIAYARGGVLDVVFDGTTGILFSEQTPESLIEALQRFEKGVWSTDTIRASVERFSQRNFRATLSESIASAWDAFCNRSLSS